MGEGGRLQLVSRGAHTWECAHTPSTPTPIHTPVQGAAPRQASVIHPYFIHSTDGPAGAEEHLVEEGVNGQLGDGQGLPV